MMDNYLSEIDSLKSQIDKLTGELLDVVADRADKPEEEKPAETEEPKEEEIQEEEIQEEETPDEETKEEEEIPEEETSEEQPEEAPEETTENEDSEEEEINNKTKRNHINMNTFITKEIRSALEDGTKKFNLNAEERAVTVTGSNGVHDSAILEHVPGLLEPLYAD